MDLINMKRPAVISWFISFLQKIDDEYTLEKHFSSFYDFHKSFIDAFKHHNIKMHEIELDGVALSNMRYKMKIKNRAVLEFNESINKLLSFKQNSTIIDDLTLEIDSLYELANGDANNEVEKEEKSFIDKNYYASIKKRYHYNRAVMLAAYLSKWLNQAKDLLTEDPTSSKFNKEVSPPDGLDFVVTNFLTSIKKSGDYRTFFDFANYEKEFGASTQKSFIKQNQKNKSKPTDKPWDPVYDVVSDIKICYIKLYIKLMQRRNDTFKYYWRAYSESIKLGIKDFTLLGYSEKEVDAQIFIPVSQYVNNLYYILSDNPNKYRDDRSFESKLKVLRASFSLPFANKLKFTINQISDLEKR